MPITCPVKIRPLSQDAFHRLDYAVMEHAFACHNALGRFCDEAIYQTDLASRLEAAGLGQVRTEVPVRVSWQAFSKTYSLDLVVQDAGVYELKADACLVGEHDAQLLNYLLLLGLNHGKLLNFGPPSVEWRFISTSLTPEKRRAFSFNERFWTEVSPECRRLHEILGELLADWGAFLELGLYREALTFFLGGAESVIQRIALARDGMALGTQRLHMHSPSAAFILTATTEHQARVESHLRRFLTHAPLRALQWINFNHFQIELSTLLQK